MQETAGQSGPRFAILGAGMAGILSGIRLQQAGLGNFTLFEKTDRLGGTWRENTYPGIGCDVPSHFYSYSFEPNPDWSLMPLRIPAIPAPRMAKRGPLWPAGRLGEIAPLPQPRRPSRSQSSVGSRIEPFEACSAFTRVPACMLADRPGRPFHRRLR